MNKKSYQGLIINFYHHYPDILYEPTFLDFYFNGHFYLKYSRMQFDSLHKILENNWHYNYPEDFDNESKLPLLICSCGMVDCSFANVNVKHDSDKVFFYDFIAGPDFENNEIENCDGSVKLGNNFVVSKDELELSFLNAYCFLAATAITGQFFIEKYNLKEKFKELLQKDLNWLLERGFLFIIFYRALNVKDNYDKEKALESRENFHNFFHFYQKETNQEVVDFLVNTALNDNSKVTEGYFNDKTSYKAYFAAQILFALDDKIPLDVWKKLSKSEDLAIINLSKMALSGKWIKKQ